MKVLVTGANGYLGQGIIKQLLDDGNDVFAVDFDNNNVDNRAERFNDNLFEIDDPYHYFKEPDVVLHLAWRNGFVHNALTHLQDLPDHYLFIDKLLSSGLKRLAVMGTMHEIGFFEGSINENTVCNPMSLYGIAKNALRQAVTVKCKAYGVALQWLRGYYIVGNSQYGSSIFSKITLAEKKHKATFPFTSGQNQWDFIDYEDFCNQVAKVLEQDTVNGIINICSGHPEKLADRVEKFIKDNNYSIKLAYGEFPDRPYDSKAVWGDDSKIISILGNKSK